MTELSAEILQWAATTGIVVMGIGMALCLYRIVRGPTRADRAMGADALGVQLLGLVILFVMRSGSLLFVDGILVLSLLSFAGTVAAAQFIARPHTPRENGATPDAAEAQGGKGVQ